MDEPAFLRAQRELARHLRSPDTAPPPAGLPPERLAVYRDAVFHNIDRFLSDNFARVRAVLPAERWPPLVRDYIARHRACTPVFAELPGEFLAYLRDERRDDGDPPFLRELAHFEWLENLLCCDEREVGLEDIDPEGDLLHGEIAVNPVHRLVSYAYPVHTPEPQDIPHVPPPRPTQLLAFRAPDFRYGVLDLNPVSLELFTTVRDAPGRSAEAILHDMARALGHPDPGVVVRGGLDILERMRRQGAILGVRRPIPIR